MSSDTVIIIPARLNSVRLPYKPLTMIGPCSMIEHVVKNLLKMNFANMYVTTDSELIAEKVVYAGGKYIMTDNNCPTGTDRVYQALEKLGDNNIKYIINVQGDMPFIDVKIIVDLIEYLKNSVYDIITPAVKVSKEIAAISSNVKVVIGANNKALYFSRSLVPYGADEFLYHIGVYGFKLLALKKFVKLPKTPLELTENLEQLRALENNIDIGVSFANSVPISIDTQEDLNKAIIYYNQHN